MRILLCAQPASANTQKTRWQLGTTLVELLLYMGLLTVFITGLTTLFLTSVETQLEGQAVSVVTQEGQFILQRIEYDVYRADAITSPSPGSSSSTLSLTIGGVTYTYQLNGQVLELTSNSVTEPLHRVDLLVSDLQFTRISDGSNFDSLRVSFDASAGARPPRGSEERSFQTTIGKR